MSALYDRYVAEIVPELREQRKYANPHMIPRLTKIVVSTGISTDKDRDVFDEATAMLGQVTGQRPVVTKARQSIAGFKLREGQPVGLMVTLRGARMYDFFQRLVCVALPRVRDFRGVSAKAFDGHGNYSMGVSDQSIFTEIDLDKMKHTVGFNITVVTSAETDEEAHALLLLLGVPFGEG